MESKWLPFTSITTAPASAAARVLGVGELIEHVLIQLDAADIVRCRRVSHKFHETASYSKTIRQKLFLERHNEADRVVNSLAPSWFRQQKDGYREGTVACRIDISLMWQDSLLDIRPLWDRMLISQPPTTSCVIPAGFHLTICPRRYYPEGMTFGDLMRAIIAAYEIRKGRRSSRERLDELSEYASTVFMYWK